MKILLTGATGFIGSRLRCALMARGHEVVPVARRAPAEPDARGWLRLDFAQATTADWRNHLQGVDAVVNTVGIFRETEGQTFGALHVRGPLALFSACADAGVRRVVQLSALGADETASTAYHLSKKAGDDLLLRLSLDATVARPSLVFGAQGASATLFLGWASLPRLPLPAGGHQMLQPVHLDDVVRALVALLEAPADAWRGRIVALVGPRRMSLAQYLQSLRRALRLPPARSITIPAAAMDQLARLGDHFPASLFDTPSWQMLQRGNAGSADEITALLGTTPREAQDFVPPEQAAAFRSHARLQWLLPLLRLSIAMVWIFTGIVSLGVFPVEDSYDLLARTGVPSSWQPAMLFGAAAFDLALGIATLWPLRERRWLWWTQIALILFYTAVISVQLPEFWLHPYGPLLKNLPMLAALVMLAMLEPHDEAVNPPRKAVR